MHWSMDIHPPLYNLLIIAIISSKTPFSVAHFYAFLHFSSTDFHNITFYTSNSHTPSLPSLSVPSLAFSFPCPPSLIDYSFVLVVVAWGTSVWLVVLLGGGLYGIGRCWNLVERNKPRGHTMCWRLEDPALFFCLLFFSHLTCQDPLDA